MSGAVTFPRLEGEEQATNLRFRGDRIVVDLADGRTISTPLDFYPTLRNATPRQRARWDFMALGTGVEWPEFDLQLPVAGFVDGTREHLPPPGWREGLADRLTKYRRKHGLRARS
jgi:hypothetical protein